MIKNPAFLKMAVVSRLLTDDDARRFSAKYGGDDFAVLMHLVKGAAARKDILGKLWGDALGLSYVDLTKTIFQGHVVQKIPEEFAKHNKVIPLYQFGETITVATGNPTDALLLKETEKMIGKGVSPVFSFPDDIDDAIVIQYQSSNSLRGLIEKVAGNPVFRGTSKISIEQMEQFAGDQSIIQFVSGVILFALKERASDVHIEPAEDAVRIRFRIDGVLQERLKLDSLLLAPLVSRLKILAKLDITERRRPQDGRITLPLTTRSIDIRLSSVPTIYGEKIAMRILGSVDMKDVPDLRNLQLSRNTYEILVKIIGHPNGVFFVTGPTGSGKTTTLYSVIKHINKPGINIMTVEDPVEIRMPGINQVQVNHEIGLDFSTALRAFLRQDPDVILVGEIRDADSARIAAQAALTGHLVLATMHTNNALQAVTRLVEIGIEPFLVAPSIIGTMAQRLVRRLCDHCKERYLVQPEEMDSLFVHDGTQEVYFYHAKGCSRCDESGYNGRIAIHEILIITEEIRHMVARDASILEIQECAHRSGFKTMRYDGIKKVLRGMTSIEEIDRATIAEVVI